MTKEENNNLSFNGVKIEGEIIAFSEVINPLITNINTIKDYLEVKKTIKKMVLSDCKPKRKPKKVIVRVLSSKEEETLRVKQEIKAQKQRFNYFTKFLLGKNLFNSKRIEIKGLKKPYGLDFINSKEERIIFNQNISFYSKIEQEKILSNIKAKKKYDKNIKRLNKRKFKKLIDDINLLSNVGLSHLVRQLNFKSIVTRKLKKNEKIK